MSSLYARAGLGLVYLGVIMGLICPSVAIYAKALPWQRGEELTIVAPRSPSSRAT